MVLLLEPAHHHRHDYSEYSDQQDVDGLSGSRKIAEMRIVLVEWRIIKGQENLFLSRVEDRKDFPWMTCELSPDWTCFVNVGLWRDADAFQAQIGWRLNDKRPKMSFEHERRRRTFFLMIRCRL